MPLPAGANLQIVIYGQDHVSLKALRNIFCFKARATPVDGSTQESVANAFAALIVAQFRPLLSSITDINAVLCRNYDVPEDLGTFASAGVPFSGTGNADALPAFNCVTVQWKTGLRGRQYRGSTHWAMIPEADTDDYLLSAAKTTAWSTALTNFQTTPLTGNIATTQWDLAVFSPFLTGTTINPTTFKSNKVTSFVLNRSLGTMKRRKHKTVTA